MNLMTRQQRRYRDRELNKIAKGMAYIVAKKYPTIVDHNHFEFLKTKAMRLKGADNGTDTSQED